MIGSVIFAFLLLWTSVASSAELLPVDEAAKEPGFKEFRDKLLRAVGRKDGAYLLGALAPDILNSFGGGGGKNEFARQWSLDSPHSKIWKELGWILTHGGSFSADGSFCAPYVYSIWPHNYDPFEYAAVIAGAAPVRKTRSKASGVIARFRYEIVKVLDQRWQEKKPEELVRVKGDSVEGFLPASGLRSPIDYRACFEKRKDRWVMAILVAGD